MSVIQLPGAYKQFAQRHTRNGAYDPRKGMEALIGSLTPDPKASTLVAMNDGRIYHSHGMLDKAVKGILNGADPPSYSWTYCAGSRGSKHQPIEGSLVTAGLVNYEDNGYRISEAGSELGVPLALKGIEFVNSMRRSRIPHRYDSLVRVLGLMTTYTDQSRPLAVYDVVKFLLDYPMVHRMTDMIHVLKDIEPSVFSRLVKSLGDAGIIDFQSPQIEMNGQRGKGFVTYYATGRAMDIDAAMEKIREAQKRADPNRTYYFEERGHLTKVLGFIGENPDITYEPNDLGKRLKLGKHASEILSRLATIGVIKKESGFTGKSATRVKANDLTRMLYDIVLRPAWNAATRFTVPRVKEPSPEDMRVFVENYLEERSNIGHEGGKIIRRVILNVLPEDGSEMKLGEITDIGNGHIGMHGRSVDSHIYGKHLAYLMGDRKVVKTREGYYALAVS